MGMLDRFDPSARRALVLAQEQARELEHHEVHPEHLLLGLIALREAVASHVLSSLGLTAQVVREQLAQSAADSPRGGPAGPHFSAGARRLLELAVAEADDQASALVGTEHLLLAMTRDDALTLSGLRLHPGRVRQATLEAARALRDARVRVVHDPDGPAPGRLDALAQDLQALRAVLESRLDELDARVAEVERRLDATGD